jgi:hypothetical protein
MASETRLSENTTKHVARKPPISLLISNESIRPWLLFRPATLAHKPRTDELSPRILHPLQEPVNSLGGLGLLPTPCNSYKSAFSETFCHFFRSRWRMQCPS